MKIKLQLCNCFKFAGATWYLAVSLAGGALLAQPAAFAAATTTVSVDQQPLTVQQSVPPNIVLMLDDSGSMAWDVMPDYGYLSDTSQLGLINSGVNGVYYNPSTVYAPPPQADGTSYPQANFSAALENGFDLTGTGKTVDLSVYDGSDDSTGGGNAIQFTTAVSTGTGYAPSACPAYASPSTKYPGYCYFNPQNGHSYNFYDNSSNNYYVYTCNSTQDAYKYVSGSYQCIPQVSFFTFSTGSAGGGYTRHYVAKNTGDCSKASLASAVCDESDAARQNVANWFSYYHTRILMAKSGLMNALNTLNPNYRFGFASINANAMSSIPSSPTPFVFNDYTSGGGNSNNQLAVVQPFGTAMIPDPTNPSSGLLVNNTNSQRYKFWNWLVNESASGNTPLRKALQGAGMYYQTSQPWQTMLGDPGFLDPSNPPPSDSPPLACRASYTILTTDGFWNGQTPSGIGDADGTPGPTITGPNAQSYSYTPVQPYSDTGVKTDVQSASCSKNNATPDGSGNCNWTQIQYQKKKNNSTSTAYGTCTQSPYSGYYSCSQINSGSYPICQAGYTWNATNGTCTGLIPSGTSASNTLADVAMYYWNQDLQPSIANQVPASTEDPAFWQHMTTFTMGLGFVPTGINPAGTTVDQIFSWANGGSPITNFSWPTPSSNSVNNIADLAHAAVNGHGAFFSATNPQAFSAGISSALKRVAARVGTGASLAANSTSLDAGTVVYQANYFTGTWKGDLKALPVNQSNGAVATSPTWEASKVMPAAASRTIQTWNGTGFISFANGSTGTPPALSSAQATALGGGSGGSAATEAALVNYLRGDASQEQPNGPFRSRGGNVLGDVVHSQPVYSGTPAANEFVNQTFNGSSVFQAWAVSSVDASGTTVPSAASTRTPLIFVAGNDGMLHAFNATTGVETYAYLPGAVITAGLKDLSDPTYGDVKPHQFYNDGELTIADAYIKLPSDSSPQWHTILVGTTGRGPAMAVYALDITNPASITPLWERSAGDGGANSNYIGQMVGKPVIAQTSTVSGATPSSSWSVLMGNGYNSAAGVSALLQFDLASGNLSVHTTADSSQGNGLAAPVVWMDEPANGVGTEAYAGDLHGQVWSFALNDATGANPTPTSVGTLLFTAKDASGNVQPITAGMLAGRNPMTNDVWLFFGTGEYLSVNDLSDINTQTWYGIIVQSSTGALVSNLSQGRSSLVQRTVTSETAASGSTLPARTVSTATPNDMNGKSGWYLDLLGGGTVQQGERMVDPNQFQRNLLIGVTRIAKATDICSPTGSGWIMALNAFTGTAPTSNFFDVNRDGFINAADSVGGSVAAGVGFNASPNAPIFVGNTMEVSFDNGTIGSLGTSASTGSAQRVNWRELTTQ